MRDRLPVNGAGAVNLPDPQEKEPVVLAECSGPKCNEEVTTWDEDAIYDNETGLWFCSTECYVAYKLKQGDIERVVA